jgi:uncharacterized membrane protein (DUF2068 family)
MATNPLGPRRESKVLLLIGAFKLFKAALLLTLGLGALRLLHREVAEQLEHWVSEFRVDPHNRHLHAVIAKLGLLDDGKLRAIGFGSFFYSALLLIEGVGLCLRKRWAEFFTIGMTASLLPLEVYELWRHVTPIRIMLLVVNLAIVVYLAAMLRRERHAGHAAVDNSPAGHGSSHTLP